MPANRHYDDKIGLGLGGGRWATPGKFDVLVIEACAQDDCDAAKLPYPYYSAYCQSYRHKRRDVRYIRAVDQQGSPAHEPITGGMRHA